MVLETYRCNTSLTTSWYTHNPYTYFNTTLRGTFPHILDQMVSQCCSTCTSHQVQTVVDYKLDAQGKPAYKLNNSNLLNAINLGSHLNFHVYGRTGQTGYSVYGFVPVVDSPGIAFITISNEADQTNQAVSTSVLNNWPLFLITILPLYIFGVVNLGPIKFSHSFYL